MVDNSSGKLSNLQYHEAMDRTQLVAQFIDDTLRIHPVYTNNDELLTKVDSAIEILVQLYGEILEMGIKDSESDDDFDYPNLFEE